MMAKGKVLLILAALALAHSAKPLLDEYSDPDLLDATMTNHLASHHHRHHIVHGSNPEPEIVNLDLEDEFLSDYTAESKSPVPEVAPGTRPSASFHNAPSPVKLSALKPQKIDLSKGEASKAHNIARSSEHMPSLAVLSTSSSLRQNTTSEGTANDEVSNAEKIAQQEREIEELRREHEETMAKFEEYEKRHQAMSSGTQHPETDANGKTEFIKGYEGGFKVGYETGWNMATEDLKKRYNLPGDQEPITARSNVTQPPNTNATTEQAKDLAKNVTNMEAPTQEVQGQLDSLPSADSPPGTGTNLPKNNMFRNLFAPQGNQNNLFSNYMPPMADPETQQAQDMGNAQLQRGASNPFLMPQQQQQAQMSRMPQMMQPEPQQMTNQFSQMFSQPQPQAEMQMNSWMAQQQQQQQQPQQGFQQPFSMQSALDSMQQALGGQSQNQGQFSLFGQPSQQQQQPVPQGLPGKAMAFLNNIKGMLQEGKNTVSAVRDALRPPETPSMMSMFSQTAFGSQQQQAPQMNPMGQFAPMFQNLMQTGAETTPSAPAPSTGGDLLSTLASLLGGGSSTPQVQAPIQPSVQTQAQSAMSDQNLGLTNLAQLLASASNSASAAPKPVVSHGNEDSTSLGLQEMQNMIQEG